jgi:hypothetical protein
MGSQPADHQLSGMGGEPGCYPDEIGSKPDHEIGSKPGPEIGSKPAGYNTTYPYTTDIDTTDEDKVTRSRASASARPRTGSHDGKQESPQNNVGSGHQSFDGQHTARPTKTSRAESAEPLQKATELPLQLTEADLNNWNELYNFWGVKSEQRALIRNKADRAETDKSLVGDLRLYADADPQVLGNAVLASMNTVKSKRCAIAVRADSAC